MDTSIDIRNYLPHCAPMLMVDMILTMDETNVKTEFKIHHDNIFVANGVFTEAGLIENAAQTCSSVIAQAFYINGPEQDPDVDVMGFISAIKKLSIISLPRSGTTIKTKSALVSKFVTDDYSLCTMACQTFGENGQLLLEGELNLFIQEKNQTEAR
jgi:predicted hotdog family 3-hydroxylacyl-ACP dehydratase